jgi:predicted dehydrogenase
LGANNRIAVGYIGLGVQGKAHISLQKQFAAANNIAQVAVCDLSAHRLAEAKELIGGNCKAWANYAELLGNNDVEAVVISTPEHAHADLAIAALQAGKHIYLEKPMSRYLGEAFAIYDLAKKNPNLVFQIGSQGCSDAKWLKARTVIAAGKVGKLVLGQASYMRNSKEGEWNATKVDRTWMKPADLEWTNWQGWDKWQGHVRGKIAYDPERFVRWRKYYAYSAGPLGDLCPHTLHPVMLATGNPEFPTRVVSLAQKPVDADITGNPPPGEPERDCPEDLQLVAEFPSGLALVMVAGTVNQVGLDSVIRGHRATLVIGGNRVELRPESALDDVDPETFPNLAPAEAIEGHEANWFDCIRGTRTASPRPTPTWTWPSACRPSCPSRKCPTA